jgi:HD domain
MYGVGARFSCWRWPSLGWCLPRRNPCLCAISSRCWNGRGGALVRSAREPYDGSGYPDGLSGDDIPLGARIIAGCAALAAMTSDRLARDLSHASSSIWMIKAGWERIGCRPVE